MTPDTEPGSPAAPARKKPHFSFLLATWFGLGYLPKAPGTFGSLGGVALAVLIYLRFLPYNGLAINGRDYFVFVPTQRFIILLAILISGIGVFVASRTASYLDRKDPQIVVIDEVSGQLIAYFGIGAAMPNWKYLLLGFILFRVFDIWKPFPARQAESLPGGWGIMADDWIAGIYAALGLWAARAIGL